MKIKHKIKIKHKKKTKKSLRWITAEKKNRMFSSGKVLTNYSIFQVHTLCILRTEVLQQPESLRPSAYSLLVLQNVHAYTAFQTPRDQLTPSLWDSGYNT